jgi:hypothetical protein
MWKVQAEIYLSPCVKYGFHRADFHESIITQKDSVGSSWTEFYPDRVKILTKFYLRP